jgi:GT2 family glycosyltransferase
MKKNIKPELSIILVNWNCGEVILNCIESLINTIKKHSYEIIVVDNDSKDGSIKQIEEKFSKVKIIKNKFNNMFAGANNQGYENSRGEYILILNTDTIVTPQALDKLLDCMKNGKEQAITCTLLNKDGTIQRNMHRGFPTIIRLVTSALYKKYKIFGIFPSVRNYLSLDQKFDEDFYAEQAPGAMILISRKLIKRLGYLFDEKNFPLFYNDVDLCYRIKSEGVKVLCKVDVQIYHLKGESVKKLSSKRYLIEYLTSLNNFFRKHHFVVSSYFSSLTLKFYSKN